LAAERSENNPALSGVQDRRRDFNAEARMQASVVAGVQAVAPNALALLIDVKTQSSRLSPEQRAVHDSLIALGTPPSIVRSIDDAHLAFAVWGLTTREAGR
jgi:hypothetical protein